MLALYVKNEELTHILTLCFHFQYFCLFVGTRVQVLECIFMISKRLILSLIYSESTRY